MDAQPSPEPQPQPPPSRIRGLAEAGLLYFEARSRLFQIEAQEAGFKLSRVVALGVFALGFLGGAWLLLMPVVVWLTAKWLQVPWTHVAGVLGAAHLIVGGILALRLRQAFARLKLFEETINQIHRDREWIGGHKNSGT